MRKIISIICILLILVLSGCSNSKINESGQNNFENESEHSNGNSSNSQKEEFKLKDYETLFSGEIVIYSLYRDNFLSFLKSPSYDLLKEKCDRINTYSAAGMRHQTQQVNLYKIEQEFLDFFGNREEIQKYISQKGFKGQIECMAVIDAGKFPMMLWVKTTSETVYITLNDSVDDLLLYYEDPSKYVYNYRCYSEAEFCEKFGPKDAELKILGKKVQCTNTPIIFYDDMDIPLLETLAALGAEITCWPNKTEIKFNNKVFYLNIKDFELEKEGSKRGNLLLITGGAITIYPQGDDLMVDDAVLSSVLYDMGKPISISLDWQNRTISIKYRDA